jgi:SusD family.
MKRIFNITFIGTLLMALFLVGCSDILSEKPRSTYTPEYFKTQAGVVGGLTALYANLRYLYGNGYFLNANQISTDESTWGQNSDLNVKNLDFSSVGTIDPSTSNTNMLWNDAFSEINTASGVIGYGATAGVSNSLIAEARFFRSFYYFLMVQTYGGVPLDLGAGELKFNTSTARTSTRNTVPEVYTKAIFPDLLQAITDLPATGRVTGGVTQTAARLMLAKAYLTYGWWLENPNNIPTYPSADRTDPNGHNAAWYYQQAYSVATAAISNPGPFGLQSTFYNVNVGTNDRNSEIILYADRTQNSETYNGGSLTYSSGGFSTDNFAQWFEQFNYTTVRSSTSNSSWASASSVQREALQGLGRPWTMLAPPQAVFYNTFADKTNDSRYDGTFTTSYRGNWTRGTISQATLYNANFMPIAVGDPVLSFLKNDTTGVDYSNSKYNSNVGGGVLPTRADFVIEPKAFSRICYPAVWKLGPYRTDNGTTLGQPNASITRPFPIAKFSELFFIAAEAAIKGATTAAVTGTYANDGTARGLINVIRARAGKWNFNNAKNIAYSADFSTAMMAATPATITIDYILAERSREYFGEGYRWFDLVRTQKWASYGASFTICGGQVSNCSDWKNHTQETLTRTIGTGYYLRPIPQGQLDALDMTADQKKAYQNPAYQ